MNADRTVATRSRTRPLRYLIFIAFLAVGASAQTTYYADATNGNDMYDGLAPVFDGTHGPKATIQAGIGVAVSGDTVQAAQSTYYETINFNGKDITVTSTDPDDAEGPAFPPLTKVHIPAPGNQRKISLALAARNGLCPEVYQFH